MNKQLLVGLFDKYDFIPSSIENAQDYEKAQQITIYLLNEEYTDEIECYISMIGNAMCVYESKLNF